MSTTFSRLSLATALGLAFLLALADGCGGSSIQKNLTAEERFAEGKKRFDEHSYTDASTDFEIIRLQFPGSAFADQAQYYLGECHFELGEFLLAAEEYSTLKRNMPASTLVPAAQYKIALCYYNLSPRSSLDQAYTARAIDEFQSFIEYYPKNDLVPDAEAKIKELNNRLARKLFEAGDLYMKMNYLKAAVIYYSAVVEKYHDTPYAERALIGKIRALIARKKYDDAGADLDRYFERYPTGAQKGDAEGLRKELDARRKGGSSLLLPRSEGSSSRDEKGYAFA